MMTTQLFIQLEELLKLHGNGLSSHSNHEQARRIATYVGFKTVCVTITVF